MKTEKQLENAISKQLEATLDCKFKRTVIYHLLGKGWACVHVKTYSRELAKSLMQKK